MNKITQAIIMQDLTAQKMKDIAGTERRAQVSLYGEPAWNKFHNHISYALDYLITLNHNN